MRPGEEIDVDPHLHSGTVLFTVSSEDQDACATVTLAPDDVDSLIVRLRQGLEELASRERAPTDRVKRPIEG